MVQVQTKEIKGNDWNSWQYNKNREYDNASTWRNHRNTTAFTNEAEKKQWLESNKQWLEKVEKQWQDAKSQSFQESNDWSSHKWKEDEQNSKWTQESNELQKKKDTSNVPCKFFLAGYCKNGTNCAFSHEPKEKEETKDTSLVPCKFFMSGKCKNWTDCKFSHCSTVIEAAKNNPNWVQDQHGNYEEVKGKGKEKRSWNEAFGQSSAGSGWEENKSARRYWEEDKSKGWTNW